MLPDDIFETVRLALDEDIGTGDVTATLIPEDKQSTAEVIAREDFILCGAAWFEQVFFQLDPAISIRWLCNDGDQIMANQPFCVVQGQARAMLSGERTALNFLQTLSGTATLAHQYVQRLKGSSTRILDTRKTIPGLRSAQKYAVLCGGCSNHRMGLYDGILIKENHIAACGSIGAAVNQARNNAGAMNIEVEVENLEQLREALDANADILLLDNFDIPMLAAAVDQNKGRAKLEASGGITLDNIREIADTGVDYISIGALTKHVRAIDLSMRIISS